MLVVQLVKVANTSPKNTNISITTMVMAATMTLEPSVRGQIISLSRGLIGAFRGSNHG